MTIPAATPRADFDLQSAILGRLDRDRAFTAGDIGVLVQDTAVTPCGVVDTIAHRRAAVLVARSVPGVTTVIDELLIHLSVSSSAAVDGATTAIVARALSDDPRVPGEAIRVSAKDGTVVLSGTVRSDDQRAAARRAVERVRDVRVVDMRIELGPRSTAGDALDQSRTAWPEAGPASAASTARQPAETAVASLRRAHPGTAPHAVRMSARPERSWRRAD